MNPVAFTIFGISIMWYGIFISCGILLALYVGKRRCEIYNLDFDKLTDVFIVALPSAIIGARLYYVIFNWSYYAQDPAQIINIRGGGLAIHGAIIGALISGYIMCRVKKLDFFVALDVAAPCFAIGQAIGRWGNFFNGEAHGGEVSKEFISRFPAFIQKGMYIDGAYYHPTFLYESCWDLLVFITILLLTRKKMKNGSMFYIYLILYSVGRFMIEGLRTDSLMLGPIRVAQLISILLIILALILLFVPIKKQEV